MHKPLNAYINRETISYIIFGVLTTAVDWIVFTVLSGVNVDYRAATALSWAASVLFAFFVNKVYVFQSRDWSLVHAWKEFVIFVAGRSFTGLFNLAAIIFLVDFLNLNKFLSKLLISAVVLVLNYVVSKLFIFRKKVRDER